MKNLLILLLSFILLGCDDIPNEKSFEGDLKLEIDGRVLKKIYIKDKLGYTHEILISSPKNRLGGLNMLDLCVYKEE